MKKVMAVFLAGILILGQSFSALEVRAQESTEEGRKDKTETVYVKADAEGSVQDISVETVLRNRNNGEDIPDYSTLSDIKNMEGDEEFTQDSDGMILWENNGENISYKGKKRSRASGFRENQLLSGWKTGGAGGNCRKERFGPYPV